jgi:chemosensory pili system protein ChpA (sensor histidine kinase/response regulator)
MTMTTSTGAPFDTGPLSWVIGEVRDALASAGAALRDAAARSAPAQPTLLLHAKTHLHQAHGALQMVDVQGVDLLTRGAEEALDRFKDGALSCTPELARPVIVAFEAVTEYLDELVGGIAPQPSRLFPYHRALQELLQVERIHPSDLLFVDLESIVAPPGEPAQGAPDYPACRQNFEKALLPYLKSGSPAEQRGHARALQLAIAPVAAAQQQAQARAFWLAMHAFAELVADGRIESDLYVKQLFGQINLQVRRLAQGQANPVDAMLRDALFFIACAETPTEGAQLLRQAWRLEGAAASDYAVRRYGKLDPAALKEARDALASAKSHWDSLGPDAASVFDDDVGPALETLAAAGERLAVPALAQLLRDLERAAKDAFAAGRGEQVNLELAAAMLFVEHGLDQVRQLPADFAGHAEVLGARLLALAAGETPPEAPQWQGELARRIQQGQTVAVLAGEIANGLRQVEQLLDAYYDDRARQDALAQTEPLLHQLQGALAILDQEQAMRAAWQVQEDVRQLLAGDAGGDALLDNIACNVSSLGFFTAMLAQDGDAAKNRFVFNQDEGLLRELTLEQSLGAGDAAEAPIDVPEPSGDAGAVEAELLEIFIAEAQEVLGFVGETLPEAQADPASQETLTLLRRAFHTLKGSARMVGLERFADTAAAIERVMNLWLAEGRAASGDLLALLALAAGEMTGWVAELVANGASPRDGAELVAAAARVQEGGTLQAESAPAPEPEAEPQPATQADAEPEPLASNVIELPTATRPAAAEEDNVKRIGTLEIALPLYNIYLAETDELVHALTRDFGEWRHEPQRAVTQEALKTVHTLAGTSATVGFDALRELASALEAALEALAVPPQLDANRRELLDTTLERMRQMLQSFGAGELEPAQPELVARLNAMSAQLAEQRAAPVYGGADPELAQRLDELFAATYEALLASPPVFAEPAPALEPDLAPQPDPAVAAVDDLFDDYLDAGIGAPAEAEEPETAIAELAPEPVPEPVLELAPEAVSEPAPEPAPATVLEAAPAQDAAEPETALATENLFSDDLDPDLLPVFVEEATDLLPQIGNGLREWQQNPGDGAPAQRLLRTLHTVKGSARMAGAMRLGQHAHTLETQIGNMLHAGTTARAAFDELMANYDQAQLLFEQLQQQDAPVDTPARAQAAAEPLAAASRTPLVRVRADLLDRVVNQAGEVSIARSRLENKVGTLKTSLSEFSDNLARLTRQLREVEMQAESQIASRLSIAGEREFDPLEFDRFTRLQELTRMMAESVNDVAALQDSLARTVDSAGEDLASQARLTRELQRDLMRVRMVPFASLSERLFRVARQTAKETDKRVNLDIRGGSTEIDRSVLEQMAAPFEHLLRNAIVHGIEPRAARAAAGKRETGELLVQVSQQGNEVAIEFHDDGAGLDFERIRAKARSVGLLPPDAEVADADAAELIFAPGFSTADALTELAGRGVGMDVVRSEAQALGGGVSVASEPGKGARFTIRLPLTLAVAQVVLVSSGGSVRALPATLVEQVMQVKEAELALAQQEGQLAVQGQRLAFHYLPALLGEAALRAVGQRSSPVMILKSATERIAVLVDEVVGNREVVVKNIGPQLSRLPGIAGATVLGSGDIILILNPVALARQAPAAGLKAAEAPAPEPVAAERRRIMVVDDSVTVRRVTQRLLEREGFQVMLAKDGVDALEQLQDELPELMLVDIEMPRMDGFDLTRSVRGNERTQDIPIIMITSRSADKHRNYALGLGVNAYFGKPYQEPILLSAISGLLEASETPAA